MPVNKSPGNIGKVSANRKYIQLTPDDVQYMVETMLAGEYARLNDKRPLLNTPVDTQKSERTFSAVIELRDLVKLRPTARICLAHAVVRGAK
jgi:hypothetical protein